MPYIKDSHKYGISELLQNVFNSEESSIGLRSLILVSSFNEQEQNRIILFTPNWYNFNYIGILTLLSIQEGILAAMLFKYQSLYLD